MALGRVSLIDSWACRAARARSFQAGAVMSASSDPKRSEGEAAAACCLANNFRTILQPASALASYGLTTLSPEGTLAGASSSAICTTHPVYFFRSALELRAHLDLRQQP